MYATFHIRNHVRDHWFDTREGLWCVFTVKNIPLRNFLTYMDVSACKFSDETTCLYTTCFIISYVGLDRHVSTQCVYYKTYSCACSHTKRRLSVHFLTYEVMLCVTLNISHLVCHIIFHRCTRNKVLHHDFLTYEPFSLTRTSPCANCHIWRRVCLQRVTKFLTFYLDHHVFTHCVDCKTCSCACSHTKKTYVCTFFELERHVHA